MKEEKKPLYNIFSTVSSFWGLQKQDLVRLLQPGFNSRSLWALEKFDFSAPSAGDKDTAKSIMLQPLFKFLDQFLMIDLVGESKNMWELKKLAERIKVHITKTNSQESISIEKIIYKNFVKQNTLPKELAQDLYAFFYGEHTLFYQGARRKFHYTLLILFLWSNFSLKDRVSWKDIKAILEISDDDLKDQPETDVETYRAIRYYFLQMGDKPDGKEMKDRDYQLIATTANIIGSLQSYFSELLSEAASLTEKNTYKDITEFKVVRKMMESEDFGPAFTESVSIIKNDSTGELKSLKINKVLYIIQLYGSMLNFLRFVNEVDELLSSPPSVLMRSLKNYPINTEALREKELKELYKNNKELYTEKVRPYLLGKGSFFWFEYFYRNEYNEMFLDWELMEDFMGEKSATPLKV